MNSLQPAQPAGIDGDAHRIESDTAGIAATLDHLGHQAKDLAAESARTVRDRALRARDSTAGYVQSKPLAALLLAAAGGAAMMLVASWLMRSSAPRR